MTIDTQQVIDRFSKLQFRGNADGLIPAFNVLVNHLPTAFWNTFADLIVESVIDDLKEAAEYLLVSAAHESVYATGHGMVTSREWKSQVIPLLHTPEDAIAALFAVVTALGWGRCEVVELTPRERMVVRARDYYEADVVGYGRKSRACAYLLQGAAGAFMDLIYGAEYPTGLNEFRALQVLDCVKGDPYAEFVVTRST
jgi:hypothetical protein